jgi:hypothetical protein
MTRQPKIYFFPFSNVAELICFYSRTSFESLSQKVEEFGNRLDRVENLAKEIATRKTDSESDKKDILHFNYVIFGLFKCFLEANLFQYQITHNLDYFLINF